MNINSLTSKLNINSIFTEKTNAANEITNSSVNNNTLFGNETEISDSEPLVMIPEQKQEETPQKKNEPTAQKPDKVMSYEDSMTLTSGTKTPYYEEINGKVYYYNSRLELEASKLLIDPASTAVGCGEIAQDWGEKTDYWIVIGNSRFYFASPYDVSRVEHLKKEEIKKRAIGRESMELEGSKDIKSASDAVIVDKGEKTEYYIDYDNVRYYYPTIMAMMDAQININPADGSCGKGRVMTKWGTQTEYSIVHNGATYYFQSEADQQAAQKILDGDGSSALKKLKFNKLTVGRS